MSQRQTTDAPTRLRFLTGAWEASTTPTYVTEAHLPLIGQTALIYDRQLAVFGHGGDGSETSVQLDIDEDQAAALRQKADDNRVLPLSPGFRAAVAVQRELYARDDFQTASVSLKDAPDGAPGTMPFALENGVELSTAHPLVYGHGRERTLTFLRYTEPVLHADGSPVTANLADGESAPLTARIDEFLDKDLMYLALAEVRIPSGASARLNLRQIPMLGASVEGDPRFEHAVLATQRLQPAPELPSPEGAIARVLG